jgi:hypothetical protein
MSEDIVAQQARRIAELEAKLAASSSNEDTFGQPEETEAEVGRCVTK